MPKPMGRVMKDEQHRIIESRELNFRNTKYDLDTMLETELSDLVGELLEDSKDLRRGRKDDRGSQRSKKLYLSRLRKAQAGAVRAILRQRQELVI